MSDTTHYCFCKRRENGSDCLLLYKSGGSIINRIYGVLKGKLKLKLAASEDGYLLYYDCDGGDYVRAGRIEAPGREEPGLEAEKGRSTDSLQKKQPTVGQFHSQSVDSDPFTG